MSRDGWGSAGAGATVPPAAAMFFAQQRLVVIAAADDTGAVWVSPLSGPPGFLQARDDRTVVVNRLPLPGDPLAERFDGAHDIGMIAIEPAGRRRVRVNGRARRDGGRLVIHTEQVYGNCPKYIQTRTPGKAGPTVPGGVTASDALSAAQRRWITTADTFFIGTHAEHLGVDTSHRGGNPGFVTTPAENRITWPEYSGNGMFMTLGNLLLEPRAGLLFLDWNQGRTLHVTGRAHLVDDPSRVTPVPGAERLVDFTVDRVLQLDGGLPQSWTFGESFRHNPPVLPPSS